MKYLQAKEFGTYKRSDIGDCAVRALANCTGYDYGMADKIMRKVGYTPEVGATMQQIESVLPAHGFRCVSGYDTLPVDLVVCTLKTGVYYVIISEHAFCLKHGKIVDLPETIESGDFVEAVFKYETDL